MSKKWNICFTVKESKTQVDGKTIIDKKEARAEITMDYDEVLILMNLVNSGVIFGLSALDGENFKAISYEDFDPACWNDYYVEKIRRVDFDERKMDIIVYNY